MMEIIRFISWGIKKMSPTSRMLYAFMVWTFILLVNLYFFGPIGFLIFFAGIVLVLLLSLAGHLYKMVIDSWDKYRAEKELEAQKILNRLKGI